MPVHLASTSRRAFMAQLGSVFIAGSELNAATAKQVDPDLIAILNDTHIGEHHPANAPIPTRLRETVASLLDLEAQPAAVIINGDLALSDGQVGDYRRFAEIISPLREADIPVHLTLGNHDDRDVFYQVMAGGKNTSPPVLSKHVSVVSLPKVNLFLLDSLKAPHISRGELGSDQLHWLGQALDTHPEKPALIFAHHNPLLGLNEKTDHVGLDDTDALWKLLTSRPHVKAYIHGHLHQRSYSQHRGIHLIDTPATAFVTRPAESTTGWTLAQISDRGGHFKTLTHLKTHPWNGAVQRLVW